ncbi:unnamed protein product [Protopolystoma xenopodis]|uniref:protein-tyrosine-phosphatase n=1 Tax=Protopolystoma xenopodis TaxID=117903 RepID=A0A3S5BYW6_9PLAT|nr:unnamed protein product [Protopolystoma xenopodis]
MLGISLFQLILELRQSRMGIIQTPDQLRFSYHAIVTAGKAMLQLPSDERQSTKVQIPLLQSGQCLSNGFKVTL